ncbi:hypothetical protein [Actinomycetospora chibensis]|uniref:Permease n=1 Tax=Actinomycetospora chibensis TaxID=663606 RepID=A0ABV9RN23_9PSEU|nr:hypothetical protein [Actinomycetospora chibensis]MDD7927793.1 hypothetical protein [Actinomycetospora chibensis]
MTTAYEADRPTDGYVEQPRSTHREEAPSPERWQDRVHWGPVWAGVVVALPVFLVLQLLFFGLGIIDLGVEGSGQSTTASIVSAVLGLIAFFVGGLMAGSTAASRDSDEGLLHGVLTWAVGIVAILGFALLGAGALLGNIATAASQLGGLQAQAGQAGQAASRIDPAQALQAAQQGAGWAALALGLTVVASAAGGLVGQGIGSTKR